jgi:FAD:protein FMN transferase
LFRISLLILIFATGTLFGHAQLLRFSFTESKMGSPFSIILYAKDSVIADNVSAKCFSLVDSLVNVFSDYIDSSELNRLCARAGTHIGFNCSPALFDILQLSKKAYEKSEGSFDITLGPVTRLWRNARKENLFPAAELVQKKLSLTGFSKVSFDQEIHMVYLKQKGMQLDLGGIGQGYIAQKVIDYLQKQQIENALVDVSGDIACIGRPPGREGWTIAVNVPESKDDLLPKHMMISGKSVTTSGDVYQYLEHEGKRYSHIIDPTTGYGITSQRNVTVIANDGATADWFTKACSILPLTEAKKIAASLHAEFLIAEIRNGRLFFHQSKGFAAYWQTDPQVLSQ